MNSQRFFSKNIRRGTGLVVFGFLLFVVTLPLHSLTAASAPTPAERPSFRTGQDSGNFSSGFTTALSSGGSVRETFPSGNVAVVSSGNSWFAEVTGGTRGYKNSDGTYNTITYPTWSSSSDSCSGGSLVGDCGGGGSDTPSCPAGTQYNYTSGRCEPVTCPAGTYLTPSNQCLPTGCTSSGKGAPAHCTPVTPIPYIPPTTITETRYDACTLDGVTVPHNQSRTFFSQTSVAYGEVCASVGQSRMCTNGVLSGSSVYNQANCAVGIAPPLGTISIDANPHIIRYGGTSRITWDGGNADSCTVSGTNFSASGVQSFKDATNITEETVYTLTCIKGPYQKSVSTTVRIVPLWQEI